jgi:hypothetical protein
LLYVKSLDPYLAEINTKVIPLVLRNSCNDLKLFIVRIECPVAKKGSSGQTSLYLE